MAVHFDFIIIAGHLIEFELGKLKMSDWKWDINNSFTNNLHTKLNGNDLDN